MKTDLEIIQQLLDNGTSPRTLEMMGEKLIASTRLFDNMNEREEIYMKTLTDNEKFKYIIGNVHLNDESPMHKGKDLELRAFIKRRWSDYYNDRGKDG